jgi:hypothetical protein
MKRSLALAVLGVLALPAHAAGLDGVTMTKGKFSIDENGFVRQTLSVEKRNSGVDRVA